MIKSIKLIINSYRHPYIVTLKQCQSSVVQPNVINQLHTNIQKSDIGSNLNPFEFISKKFEKEQDNQGSESIEDQVNKTLKDLKSDNYTSQNHKRLILFEMFERILMSNNFILNEEQLKSIEIELESIDLSKLIKMLEITNINNFSYIFTIINSINKQKIKNQELLEIIPSLYEIFKKFDDHLNTPQINILNSFLSTIIIPSNIHILLNLTHIIVTTKVYSPSIIDYIQQYFIHNYQKLNFSDLVFFLYAITKPLIPTLDYTFLISIETYIQQNYKKADIKTMIRLFAIFQKVKLVKFFELQYKIFEQLFQKIEYMQPQQLIFFFYLYSKSQFDSTQKTLTFIDLSLKQLEALTERQERLMLISCLNLNITIPIQLVNRLRLNQSVYMKLILDLNDLN